MKKISCIIPAHNEEKNIHNVLRAVAGMVPEFISEIIVVDDGSKDKTQEIARQFSSVKIIAKKKNEGKSRAVISGILQATEENILLLDADLINLEKKAIISLIKPVSNNLADVAISIRKNSPFWMRLINLDFMSGERIFPKKILLPKIDDTFNLPSFALEVFLNRLIIENNCRLATVRFENAENDFKWSKTKFWQGIKGELAMWKDIFKIISPWEFIHQNICLKRLMKKSDKKN